VALLWSDVRANALLKLAITGTVSGAACFVLAGRLAAARAGAATCLVSASVYTRPFLPLA
jgi:hypothetical protein